MAYEIPENQEMFFEGSGDLKVDHMKPYEQTCICATSAHKVRIKLC